jgi:hypothetical protein
VWIHGDRHAENFGTYLSSYLDQVAHHASVDRDDDFALPLRGRRP